MTAPVLNGFSIQRRDFDIRMFAQEHSAVTYTCNNEHDKTYPTESGELIEKPHTVNC